MVHGVGRWKEIESGGLLPGKLYQQLNGQTQRLLGQQSLAGERLVKLLMYSDRSGAGIAIRRNVTPGTPSDIRQHGVVSDAGCPARLQRTRA